ncbi:Translin [Scheffersomyces xylosifermentans]|uniref:Translin n=1 Tax=Scheffersomyces xylosifermentans TaxID=1304137 RepID=UPI00315DA624
MEDNIFLPARQFLVKAQDEREKLIRDCRDITAYSKKIIFSAHRIKQNKVDKSLYKQIMENFKIVSERIAAVNEQYNCSPQLDSLKGSVSNACEEMIEAFTFIYYVMTKKLLSYEKLMYILRSMIAAWEGGILNIAILHHALDVLLFEVVSNTIIALEEKEEPGKEDIEISIISQADYFVGLFDLTGEIMRYTITNLRDYQSEVVNPSGFEHFLFMKSLYFEVSDLLDRYPNLNVNKGIWSTSYNGKGVAVLRKKLEVFKESVDKIEQSLCDVLIRAKEEIYLRESLAERVEMT